MEKQALTGMLRHVLKIMALRVHEYVLGINESHFFQALTCLFLQFMLTSCIDERTGQGNLVTCSPSTLPLFRSIEKICLLIGKNNKWLHYMKNFLRLFSGQHHLLYFTLYKLLHTSCWRFSHGMCYKCYTPVCGFG